MASYIHLCAYSSVASFSHIHLHLHCVLHRLFYSTKHASRVLYTSASHILPVPGSSALLRHHSLLCITSGPSPTRPIIHQTPSNKYLCLCDLDSSPVTSVTTALGSSSRLILLSSHRLHVVLADHAHKITAKIKEQKKI
jgi:hypothetical protein